VPNDLWTANFEGHFARAFERALREAGLPMALLTDNGPPFVAPRGLRGWSELSVWWIRLGIRPLRTEPASPEQNGASPSACPTPSTPRTTSRGA
jgi:hypothetical protein